MVRTGLEILLQQQGDLLEGKRVGLLCNPTSVDSKLNYAADLLSSVADLHCLFGPEHGVRGEVQDMIGVNAQKDPRLGILVHSLYGTDKNSLKPRAEWVSGLDVVVIDLQDIGSRYYTYIWSMVLTMEVCAKHGVAVVVLDRPNPINGQAVEGPSIEPGFCSFVGLHPIVVRHGMTIGEIALMAQKELGLSKCKLEVVKMQDWRRSMYFDQTGLPWIFPSPNMPTLDTAIVYPGMCLLEGTNLSEGRGTTRPFEIFGAPWINSHALVDKLHGENLPGVEFRPLGFSPMFHKYAGKSCGGVQIHVKDRNIFRPFKTGVAILRHVRALWPDDFKWRTEAYEFVSDKPAIDLLAGGVWLRQAIEQNLSVDELTQHWPDAEQKFISRRREFLLYD